MKNTKSNLVVVTCLLVAASAHFSPAEETAEGYIGMEQGSRELLAILESLPYAAEGDGPVVYTFEFSECTYCQNKYRDFHGQDLGMEFRRFFVPVSDRSARETAALGKSRSSEEYHAFMQGRKAAPAFDQDNEAIDAYNAIVTAASETIPPILKQNGWPAQGLVFPAYFWFEDGKLYANGGYLKTNFEGAMARAREGWTDASRELLASVAQPGEGAGIESPATMAPSAPRESSGVDIIGIELGMTQAEALAALAAHDPRLRLYEHTVKIVAQDSNRQRLEIGTYLKGVQASVHHGIPGFNLNEEPTEKIVVLFSPPPSEHRVEFIGREVTYPTGKGPDFQAAMQAIGQKYGEPTHINDTTGATGRGPVTQFWQYSGSALNEQQFGGWMNQSGIMAPLNMQTGGFHPIAPNRPTISRVEQDGLLLYYNGANTPVVNSGLSLGITVNKQGNLAFSIRSMLWEDRRVTEERRALTWDMGNAALQQHEARLRQQAGQRNAPKL